MRDDFTSEVKRALAARVANLCSRPECRALTSGPQDDPAKAVNIGIAAHITGAAPGGPRYDPALSPEQRGDADNGIWFCQNCAKLVDNDVAQFPVEVLRAWKTLAEHHARFALGKTSPPPRPESDVERKMRRILEWKGKVVTLTAMNTGQAVMMLGPKRGSSQVLVVDCTEDYVTVGPVDSQGWKRSISLDNIKTAHDHDHNRLEIQERYD